MVKTFSKSIIGLIILFGIFFLSKFIISFFQMKFPVSLLGLMIFAILLQVKIIKYEWVDDVCNFLLKNLTLFFIPITVGFYKYYPIIKNEIGLIFITIILSIVITMLLTGLFIHNIVKIKRAKNIKRASNG